MNFYKIKNYVRDVSYRNAYMSKIYFAANKIKVNLLAGMSDKKFAEMKYKENTNKELDLENPITFNEKLWWLKINNRDPLLTICSDKVKVRDYVIEKGLEKILVPIFNVYDDARDIDFKSLPARAFIKTNHGSGINIIWDKDKPFDKKSFIKKFNTALKQNYYLQSREWNYKNIEPKLIVEEVLEVKSNQSLIDYRFLCFNGVVKMLFVDTDTAAEDGTHSPYAKRNVYDRDFNLLDIKVGRERFSNELKKPINYSEMIKYAEILSEPFEFCRMDLYNIEGKIYFGEITFYPGGCTQLFEPHDYEIKVGSWIDLNSKKIHKS